MAWAPIPEGRAMLTLRAFGALDLRDAEGAPLGSVLAQTKRAALLAYLVLSRPGELHRRDTLLALFWPETEQERGRKALSQALSFLRKEVGEEVLVTRGVEEVGVNSAQVRCDVLAFREALKGEDWAEALSLYRGDLLEGVHVKGAPAVVDWVDRERVRLREAAAGAAWRLAHQRIREGKLVEAERTAQRALALVATDESPVREFMKALVLAGDRGAALRFYEKFKGTLGAELEVEPAPETEALAQAIRGGEIRAAAPAGGPRWSAAGHSTANPTPASRPNLPRISRQRIGLVAVGVLVLTAGALALGRWTAPGPEGGSPSAIHERTAIAVLPFQNLSEEGPHAYFAAALHDELLSQLAGVAGISLRGRTSVMGYAGTTTTIREIAEELAVGSIVEATVQILDERLRVNVQLIDAATDEHIWAERYDRPMDDAFEVQSDIAQRIVAAVGATLSGNEAMAMAAAPTENPEAYLLYLQGLEYHRRPGYLLRNLEIAQELYERALALDSTFALAHAALSKVHGSIAWHRYDCSPERLAWQREAAETALRLAPGLPQARFAMGSVYYRGLMDWRAALEEYHIALEGMPNDAGIWERIGYTHRRLGEWDHALRMYERAASLDPRNANIFGDLGAGTLRALGRYEEAIEAYRHALRLAPDATVYDLFYAYTWLMWEGRLDSLRAVLDRHPPEADFSIWGPASRWRALLLLWERKPDSVLALLERTPIVAFDSRFFYQPTALFGAWAHELRGDGAAAQEAFESALALVDSVVAELPGDWRVHSSRGLALAGLGRPLEAREEARWLRESQVYREDAYDRELAQERARILAGINDADAALEEIERLLEAPSFLSVHTLRLDPRYDPIRHDPRFQALLVKYAHPGPAG
jgi:TolB-like protein/DNA-binding SARP family transcriptional activator/Flp pilus assembly protein TadD